MSREKIEENDQRLIKKIREIVHNKEKIPAKKRHPWHGHHFWLPVLFVGLIVTGLMLFSKQPATIMPENLEAAPRDTFENTEAPVVEPHPDQIAAADADGMAPSAGWQEDAAPPAPPENDPPGIAAISRETASKPPETPLNTHRSAKKTASVLSQMTEQSSNPSNIRIHELVSCSSVSNRQYVSQKTIFSIKEESPPVVWMNVLSDNPPFTLTHIYYVNGRRYCEVPLEIRHPRMRTWSYVTVGNSDHHGQWRVEVTTDAGEKLGQIEFTVVP